MAQTFTVVHPKGEIEVVISEFFTTQTARANKLFNLARQYCTDAQHLALLDSLDTLALMLNGKLAGYERELREISLETSEFNAGVQRYLI